MEEDTEKDMAIRRGPKRMRTQVPSDTESEKAEGRIIPTASAVSTRKKTRLFGRDTDTESDSQSYLAGT